MQDTKNTLQSIEVVKTRSIMFSLKGTMRQEKGVYRRRILDQRKAKKEKALPP